MGIDDPTPRGHGPAVATHHGARRTPRDQLRRSALIARAALLGECDTYPFHQAYRASVKIIPSMSRAAGAVRIGMVGQIARHGCRGAWPATSAPLAHRRARWQPVAAAVQSLPPGCCSPRAWLACSPWLAAPGARVANALCTTKSCASVARCLRPSPLPRRAHRAEIPCHCLQCCNGCCTATLCNGVGKDTIAQPAFAHAATGRCQDRAGLIVLCTIDVWRCMPPSGAYIRVCDWVREDLSWLLSFAVRPSRRTDPLGAAAPR